MNLSDFEQRVLELKRDLLRSMAMHPAGDIEGMRCHTLDCIEQEAHDFAYTQCTTDAAEIRLAATQAFRSVILYLFGFKCPLDWIFSQTFHAFLATLPNAVVTECAGWALGGLCGQVFALEFQKRSGSLTWTLQVSHLDGAPLNTYFRVEYDYFGM